MKIAILGGGFAGLGTAISLLINAKGKISIDLFDPLPIGQSVSGLSAGLLHPFPGKRAEPPKNADKLLECSHALITEASKGISRSIVLSKGIVRPAVTSAQIEAFQKTAHQYSEAVWWDQKKATSCIPGLQIINPEGGALYIKNGITISVKHYLEGLLQRCMRFSLQYHQQQITQEKELKDFDVVILAMGMGVKNFAPLIHLPLYPLKGQSIKLKWPSHLPPLPCSLISEGYVVMTEDMKSCYVGATFERTFSHNEPDLSLAKSLIFEKIGAYFPSLLEAEILDCQAGVRAIFAKTSLPICGRVNEKYWFITGLGCKGLLYHGFMAEALSQAILNDNERLIPSLFNVNDIGI